MLRRQGRARGFQSGEQLQHGMGNIVAHGKRMLVSSFVSDGYIAHMSDFALMVLLRGRQEKSFGGAHYTTIFFSLAEVGKSGRSPFTVHRSLFGVRRSAFGGRSRPFFGW
jgi:hypothetical protein